MCLRLCPLAAATCTWRTLPSTRALRPLASTRGTRSEACNIRSIAAAPPPPNRQVASDSPGQARRLILLPRAAKQPNARAAAVVSFYSALDRVNSSYRSDTSRSFANLRTVPCLPLARAPPNAPTGIYCRRNDTVALGQVKRVVEKNRRPRQSWFTSPFGSSRLPP